MEFWENVKKSVSDAATFTKEKTEKLSDVISLKISIRSEESKQNGRFEELGRLFYETYKKGQDYDEDILDTIVELDKGKEKIDALKNELAEKQHIAVCQNCGASIEKEANFCPVCGVKTEGSPDIIEK